MVYAFLKGVKAVIYDCDGVLTDNKVIVDETGKEYAAFNRGDGYAISKLFEMGIKQIVISTESNPIIIKRCEKLGLDVVNDISDKTEVLYQFLSKNDISYEDVMYIGNDLNDLNCLLSVTIRGCPVDAEPEIKELCNWISKKKGGDGVIRDLYRDIYEAKVIE